VSPDVHAVARRRVLALVGPPGSPSRLGEPPKEDAAEADGSVTGTPSRRAWVQERLPETLRGGRLALDQPAVVALGVVALVAVLFAAAVWWRARPQGMAVPEPAALAPGPSATATSGLVVVDVQGRVRRPGIVRLPAGSRAVDAVRAAGGVLRGVDTSGLNLARVLTDGEQLLVGAPPNGVAGGAPRSGSTGPGLIDLNTATVEQLDTLPGVGPVLAQRIVEFRQAHGRFSAVDELQEVSGIGPAKFASLKGKVRV
jgi:competence protein ComEA